MSSAAFFERRLVHRGAAAGHGMRRADMRAGRHRGDVGRDRDDEAGRRRTRAGRRHVHRNRRLRRNHLRDDVARRVDEAAGRAQRKHDERRAARRRRASIVSIMYCAETGWMMLSTSAEYTMAGWPCGPMRAVGSEPRTKNQNRSTQHQEPGTRFTQAITAPVYRVTPWLRRNSDRGPARAPAPLGRRPDPSPAGTPAPAQCALRPSPGSTARS